MKLVNDIAELKKGDTVIVKDYAIFSALGFARVFGDVFDIEIGKSNFSIKCQETNTIEKVNMKNGKVFLIN